MLPGRLPGPVQLQQQLRDLSPQLIELLLVAVLARWRALRLCLVVMVVVVVVVLGGLLGGEAAVRFEPAQIIWRRHESAQMKGAQKQAPPLSLNSLSVRQQPPFEDSK